MKYQPLKKLTPEQADAAVARYRDGQSLAAIAAAFNVSRQAMWDLLRRRTTLRSKLRFRSENHFYRGRQIADDHAHNMVEYAIRIGALIRREDCEECGAKRIGGDRRAEIVAHHDDYNRPLDVRWLCRRCHFRWHQSNRAIPKNPDGVLREEVAAE